LKDKNRAVLAEGYVTFANRPTWSYDLF
jgi:hypothetical protein